MNDQDKVKRAQMMKDLNENFPSIIESITLQAKMTRVRYKALINEGFTVDEALKLCAIA